MEEKQKSKKTKEVGLEIEIRLTNTKLEPKFRPLIEKIEELGRETTGLVCSEETVARLKW